MTAHIASQPVAWLATLRMALARGIASGSLLVLGIAIGDPQLSASPFQALLLLLSWVLLSLPLALACYGMARVCRVLGAVFESGSGGFISFFFNIMSFVFSLPGLFIMLGDPLVYLFNRMFPSVLDVADFKPFNLTMLITVHQPLDDRAGTEAA